jgi:hypothetical protein
MLLTCVAAGASHRADDQKASMPAATSSIAVTP